MWKNILLIAYTVLILSFVVLIASKKLIWATSTQSSLPDRIALSEVANAADISRPQLFELGDKKLICKPDISVHGRDFSVKYNLFEYKEGKLVPIETAKSQ